MKGFVIIPGQRGVRGGLKPLMHQRKHLRARSNRACHERELNNTVMLTFLVHVHGSARLDQGARFFAYNWLIIEFKGIVMKLKNVPNTISLE